MDSSSRSAVFLAMAKKMREEKAREAEAKAKASAEASSRSGEAAMAPEGEFLRELVFSPLMDSSSRSAVFLAMAKMMREEKAREAEAKGKASAEAKGKASAEAKAKASAEASSRSGEAAMAPEGDSRASPTPIVEEPSTKRQRVEIIDQEGLACLGAKKRKAAEGMTESLKEMLLKEPMLSRDSSIITPTEPTGDSMEVSPMKSVLEVSSTATCGTLASSQRATNEEKNNLGEETEQPMENAPLDLIKEVISIPEDIVEEEVGINSTRMLTGEGVGPEIDLNMTPLEQEAADLIDPSNLEIPRGEEEDAPGHIAGEGINTDQIELVSTELPPTSEAAVGEMQELTPQSIDPVSEEVEDECPAAPSIEEIHAGVVARSLPTDIPSSSGVPVTRLHILDTEVIKAVMIRELTGGMSLGRYREKFFGAVGRMMEAHSLVKDMVEVEHDHSQRLGVLEELAPQISTIAAMESGVKSNTESVRNLRLLFDGLDRGIDNLGRGMTTLREDMTSVENETTRATNEVFELTEELRKHKEESNLSLAALHRRLDNFEEQGRLDREARGSISSLEANAYKIEGFQMCVMMQAARGQFSESLLDDSSFMNLVTDMNALLLALAQTENIPRRHSGPAREQAWGRQGSRDTLSYSRAPQDPKGGYSRF